MNLINKPSIFITAPGRAGTGFLARILPLMIKGCCGVHEPDVLYFYRITGVVRGKIHLAKKIRDFGIFHMTLGKLFTRHNLRSLGLALARKKISEDEAAKAISNMRFRYVSKLKLPLYAECNPQLEGVIHLMPRVFPNSRIIYLTRDGRQWVRSFLNRTPMLFWKKDLLSYLPNSRPEANMFPDDPFSLNWSGFTQFQRLCWLWRFRTQNILNRMKQMPDAKLISYENLFDNKLRRKILEELLEFVCSFPDGSKIDFEIKEDVFAEQKVGESQYNDFPEWQSWSSEQVFQFQEICGDLQKQLGYGKEDRWLEMIAKSSLV